MPKNTFFLYNFFYVLQQLQHDLHQKDIIDIRRKRESYFYFKKDERLGHKTFVKKLQNVFII